MKEKLTSVRKSSQENLENSGNVCEQTNRDTLICADTTISLMNMEISIKHQNP